MKIGIFAYNFNHWKTQQGIINLALAGRKPEVIFAADPVKLNFYRSKIRTGPKDLFLVHPKKLAEHYNIDYCVVKHNSRETAQLVSKYNLDLGIILGARILKPIAFENFNIGVLNAHPGILPENRGLDSLKWAIINRISQGVTTHLIDEKIDRGLLVEQETINLYKDDSLLDIKLRLQHLEQKMILNSISILEKPTVQLTPLPKGSYNKSMPLEIENNLLKEFALYKKEMI